VNRDRFERLVVEALEGLPSEFGEKMDNIDLIIEEWPSGVQLRQAGLRPGSTLFGLYQGVPLTKRGRGYNMVLPDKITIFQGPIEAATRYEEDTKSLVREVVIHEIAHHFGIGDERLRELRHGQE
jgi:predicted Zn-dependent protease with MMP-like domain